MEYVLLAIVLLEGGAITYLLTKKTPNEPITIEQKEKERQERIEKDFRKLFNYTETIATRGYKDEE
jgi:predicted DNA-binding transcriptional regulator